MRKCNIKWLLILPFLMTFIFTGEAQQRDKNHQAKFLMEKKASPQFKMILRLWPQYHTDTVLGNHLIEAIKQYPFVDEIWYCMECDYPYIPLADHEKSCAMMNTLRKKFENLGIKTDIQGISIGHSDSYEENKAPYPKPKWGTLTNYDGKATSYCNCPRQQAFLDYVGDEYAIYAKAIKPEIIWLDDDLRITQHYPAETSCYCDTCISYFNRETHANWTRETLVDALNKNADDGKLRKEWIHFSQESLAGVAAAISKKVHAVSPKTRMGLQHTNFHRKLLEGYDWNLIFDAMEKETGLIPASRPGNGCYSDHAPREMLIKAYDMARQVRRLKPGITQIASEVEGWPHRATGVSSLGLCVESQLYLAMGVTQLSYAIICSASEPMDWYAEHYFKPLSAWRKYYKEYADFNVGTEPGGLNPYISTQIVSRNTREGEDNLAWSTSKAGDMIYELAPLGIPFTPDGNYPSALILDKLSIEVMTENEFKKISAKGILLDESAWKFVQQKGFDSYYKKILNPDNLTNADFYVSSTGGRLAVIPTYDPTFVNGQRRLELLHISDWISYGKLPVILETMAQMTVIPRIDSSENLRSVTLLNCSISEQEPVTLRLRGCNADAQSFVWKQPEKADIPLSSKQEGSDVLIQIPSIAGWHIGWIAITNR